MFSFVCVLPAQPPRGIASLVLPLRKKASARPMPLAQHSRMRPRPRRLRSIRLLGGDRSDAKRCSEDRLKSRASVTCLVTPGKQMKFKSSFQALRYAVIRPLP
jgi:hypothetical protein